MLLLQNCIKHIYFMVRLSGIISIILFVIGQDLEAQNWISTDSKSIALKGTRDISPNVSKTYFLDDNEIKNILWSAPKEKDTSPFLSNTTVSLPEADGTLSEFKIVEFEMMEPLLAAKYPSFKTFQGVNVLDPHKTVRIDYTEHGLRAMIMSENGFSYIDHYQRGDKNHKIVYFKNNLEREGSWTCNFDEELHGDNSHRESDNGNRQGDCIFRSYRLAVATTAEYSNFHGATSSAQSGLVLSAVITTINRVNGVMEKDFVTRMLLVNNTNLLFYYAAASDPYSNGNGGAMLSENQTTCDNIIGAANYDLGHVFSTGGGGVAYLGCICASNKAGGVTGQTSPIGDPFDIDYVAHEMGHQLGGNHTQYNNCNRSSNSAMEPGSASSIMGYAGICSPNVQNNSDAYYHARSIQEIKNEIQSNSCHATISFTNAAPTIASIPNYSIPISTPFVLTASATDPQGNPINYCWEQMNAYTAPAQTMPPASTNTTGPVFRTLVPKASPSRYFPPLANVIAGSANTWEVLPSVGRVMNFRITARDFTGVAGCTSEQNITVTTVAGSGPFTVTSQNTATTWQENQTNTITWNVANTTASPISCANVDIFLSTDGGNTYPITLLSNTPNDGSQTISVPLGSSTTTGRIMVKGSGNVFYDINNTNITIQPSLATFNLSLNPATINICNNANGSAVINVSPINGFNQNITLSASNLPSGSTGVFSTNPVGPNGSSTFTLSNLSGTASGIYNITLQGVSGSITKQATLNLVLSSALPAPIQSLPSNGATGVALFTTLSWEPVPGALNYKYEVSLSPTFSFLAASGISNTNNVTLTNNLTGNSTYYWRVVAENNCNGNPWSSTFDFTTSTCFYYNSTDIPKTLSTSVDSVTSIINLFDSGRLGSVDVFNLEGTHSNISNLKFYLKSQASGLEVLFWNNPCSNQSGFDDDFDINFSDNFNPVYPCPATNGQTYGPSNSFGNTFFGVATFGSWRLKVVDGVAGDGGTINKWAMQACYIGNFCRRLIEHPYENGIGSLYEAVNCAEPNDTITVSSALKNLTIDLGSNNLVISKNLIIKSNPADNVSIKCSSSNPTFDVMPGVNLTIIGLKIIGSNSTEGAIKNAGNLTLNNTSLLKNASVNPVQLLKNSGSGIAKFEGNCNIRN
jgi:hypothetical protein